MRCVSLVALLLLVMSALSAFSQTNPESPYYSRLNTFGLFGEYSSDSSHIVLGKAEQRKLLNFGGSYSRRLLLNHIADWQYMAEVRPLMWESDPVTHQTLVVTSPPPLAGTYISDFVQASACHSISANYSTVLQGITYSYSYTDTCRRRWTFGTGLSPVGFKFNFLPRHRIQPVFSGLLGYMFSTQPIPVSNAGSFNFTLEAGAGIELYRSRSRSIRAEYRIHHISNKNTAQANPGIDNGLFQVTYAFGR